ATRGLQDPTRLVESQRLAAHAAPGRHLPDQQAVPLHGPKGKACPMGKGQEGCAGWAPPERPCKGDSLMRRRHTWLVSLFALAPSLAAPGAMATPNRLAPGVYECIVGGASTMDMRITGANSYSIPDGAGKFHVETNGRIVFDSGPLRTFSSKLLSGGRIGLNTD